MRANRPSSPIVFLIFLPACATLSGSTGSSTAPFQGTAAVEARRKEVYEKRTVSDNCFKTKSIEGLKRGFVEVTAAADGKLVPRTLIWQGDAAIEACVLDAARKAVVSPLPGPTVSTFWDFFPVNVATPTPPDMSAPPFAMQEFKGKVQLEVNACAQRLLPPDFPANIELAFFLFPGGHVAATNVVDSTANDGSFDSCVQQVIATQAFPDAHYDGPYPLKLRFHVGPLEKH